MRKRIINPAVGENVDAFEASDEIDELVHSDGVVVDCPGYRRVYLSGIVAIDDDGDVVAPGDVETQTRTVLRQIESYLADVGGEMNDVVRVRVYVESPELTQENFDAIHEARREFFDPGSYPASTLVEVDGLIREGRVIEIDADAVVPHEGWE